MEYPERKDLRLKNYDYSQNGAYFITICTHGKRCLFGRVTNNACRGDPCGRPRMELNRWGRIAAEAFSDVERMYGVKIDERVVMPNHIHFVIMIESSATSRATARVAPTVGRIVGAYKSLVYNKILSAVTESGGHLGRLWQRNYYEHVIRNNADLYETCGYIQNNPAKWVEDKLYSTDIG